jgi:hypothetical protein
MRLTQCLLALVVATSLCGCWTDDISGTYVGGSSRVADLVQLVQSADGHLTGRFAVTEMKQDGTVSQEGGVADGSYRNGNVVVTFHIIPVFVSLTFSGTVEGEALALTATTGNDTHTMSLQKSDEAHYQARVEEIRHSAQSIQAAQAQAEAQRSQERAAARRFEQLTGLIRHEQVLVAKAASFSSAISKIEGRYRAVTARMTAALTKEESLWGNSQAAVERSQISVAVAQMAINCNQLHMTVQQNIQTVQMTYNPVIQNAIQAEAACAGIQATSGGTVACRAFLEIDRMFWRQIDAEKIGFNELEDVYRSEKVRQDAIQRESQSEARRM